MRILGYGLDDTEHGKDLAARFDRGFTACDPNNDNALDLDEFREFVKTVAPDAAVKIELVLSKGYTVLIATGTPARLDPPITSEPARLSTRPSSL